MSTLFPKICSRIYAKSHYTRHYQIWIGNDRCIFIEFQILSSSRIISCDSGLRYSDSYSLQRRLPESIQSFAVRAMAHFESHVSVNWFSIQRENASWPSYHRMKSRPRCQPRSCTLNFLYFALWCTCCSIFGVSLALNSGNWTSAPSGQCRSLTVAQADNAKGYVEFCFQSSTVSCLSSSIT